MTSTITSFNMSDFGTFFKDFCAWFWFDFGFIPIRLFGYEFILLHLFEFVGIGAVILWLMKWYMENG